MKKFFLIITVLFASFFLSGCNLKEKKEEIKNEETGQEIQGGEEEMKGKILMVLAPVDFQEKEYFIPKSIFEENKYQVVTASTITGQAKSSVGTLVQIDKKIEDVDLDEFWAVVFVGGPGTVVFFENEQVLNLAKEAVRKNKVVGAICIAPSILANAEVLNGRTATAYPSERKNLEAKGALFVGEPVVVDGNIVTGNGPAAAEEFAKKIVEIIRTE